MIPTFHPKLCRLLETRCHACFLLGVLVVMALLLAFVAPAARTPMIGARQLSIPIYQERSVVAVVKIGNLSRANKKIGFIQVKLLPLMAFDDVRVELQQPELPRDLLEKIYSGLQSFSEGVPYELRNFQMIFPNEKTPRLRAQRVQPFSKKFGPGFIFEGVMIRGRALPPDLSSGKTPEHGETGKLRWEKSNSDFEALLGQTLIRPQPAQSK